MPSQSRRLYLSPPHIGELELEFVREAFASNWIAPEGPQVDAFERELANLVGADHAVALASGTAALHLALILAGVEPNDRVMVSDLTFVAPVNAVRYVGAQPVLVDAETTSWNMDPDLVVTHLEEKARQNDLPRALVLVHAYGQCADTDPIARACGHHGVVLIEDAAESVGSSYRGRAPGTDGHFGVFSFNGNKVITTSGGGMLVSNDGAAMARARKLARQAREDTPWCEHREVGFTYRLSNICAAIGLGQLRVLADRVAACRENFAHYAERLGDLPGLTMAPEAPWGRHTRWLSCLLLDAGEFGATPEDVRRALEADNIESRPVWKPMHMQPLYRDCPRIGGTVAEDLFARGLCLPSGSDLSHDDRERVIAVIRSCYAGS